MPAEIDAVPERRQIRDDLERAQAAASIGKNVPEKRNIGRMTKRKIATNDASFSVCAPHAAIGVEYARPTSTATGTARIAERRLDRAERGDDDEVDRRGHQHARRR